MNNYLVTQALQNVWCTPEQDLQCIIQPARVTRPSGAMSKLNVAWEEVLMPDTTSVWHVYQIGQLHPLILGLLTVTNEWTSFKDACNAQNMLCDVYTQNGVQVPRFESYYTWTPKQNLLIVVKENLSLPYSFSDDALFFRFYSNAFFNSTRMTAGVDKVYVNGIRATSSAAILTLQADYDAKALLPGSVYAFVNGLKVPRISLITVQVGDVAEIVYDSSIYKVVEFAIKDLNVFASTLDSKLKYLLHYAGGDTGNIDYQDDIDVYIIDKYTTGKEAGLFYHKNNADAIRNLTHRDYSLVTAYVDGYANAFNKIFSTLSPIAVRDMFVRLYIRKAGYSRPLVFESNRIHDLYKMPDSLIIPAMVGAEATVSVWKAAALENSHYCKVMRSSYNDITPALAQQMFGYNAIAKMVGGSPVVPFSSGAQFICNVPYVCRSGSTAFEYDTNGALLGWYVFVGGTQYVCANTTARLVEFTSGIGTDTLDEYYGQYNITINPNVDYRVYACTVTAGVPDHVYKDVTGNNAYYQILGNQLQWSPNSSNAYPFIRSDANVLVKNFTASLTNGILGFAISSIATIGGVTANVAMKVPMQEFELFMNNKKLIRGLDYIIDFPNVIVNNKEYLINPNTAAQTFTIRGTGFCSKTLQLTASADIGFVKYNTLSDNKRYDLRDDRVITVTVDGSVKNVTSLTFAEDGFPAVTNSLVNGRPYQLEELPVGFKDLNVLDYFSEYTKAQKVNAEITDYLSLKIPVVEPSTPFTIAARYQISSPFCAKILSDLSTGLLVMPAQTGPYGRMVVTTACAPYEYLLKCDPTQTVNKVDSNFVIIHPVQQTGPVTINAASYQFMSEVLTYYTNSLINLSSFVTVV